MEKAEQANEILFDSPLKEDTKADNSFLCVQILRPNLYGVIAFVTKKEGDKYRACFFKQSGESTNMCFVFLHAKEIAKLGRLNLVLSTLNN